MKISSTFVQLRLINAKSFRPTNSHVAQHSGLYPVKGRLIRRGGLPKQKIAKTSLGGSLDLRYKPAAQASEPAFPGNVPSLALFEVAHFQHRRCGTTHAGVDRPRKSLRLLKRPGGPTQNRNCVSPSGFWWER